ncbi:MAG: Inner-rane translocator [Chloroflexi bacterium]|jgi:branched-chain amino acid transport system permease protein|nr:Inner-rane translocator [Chloroflexota bacterium]
MVENQDPVVSAVPPGRSKIVKPAIYGGVTVIVALLPLFIKSPYMIHIFILTLIYIIAAVSLRTITVSGQMPLAHAGFMGIGGYAAAMLAKWVGLSPWITLIVGALVAMAISIFIGFPFARLRTIYYTMVSLFFGTAVLSVIFALGKWTGSYSGLTGIPGLFPITSSKVPYFYVILGICVASLVALWRFENCRIGLSWKAISQSYMVASSVGINEARYRVFALAVGSFFVGLAGAVYAHYNLTLSYTTFNLSATLFLFMYVLIGGLTSFPGPIVGTAILFIVPELFRDLKSYTPLVQAFILLVVVFAMPQGLVGLPQLIKSLITGRKGESGNSKASIHAA